jgi:hypothetical protein
VDNCRFQGPELPNRCAAADDEAGSRYVYDRVKISFAVALFLHANMAFLRAAAAERLWTIFQLSNITVAQSF